MPGRFEYKVLAKYPHLCASDAAIWERFINRFPGRFNRCDYDVHIGEGIPPASEWEPQIIFMAMYLTQCRIDVLAFNNDQATIIEVKRRAMTDAIGQLLSYQALYKLSFNTTQNLPLLLICEDIPNDIKRVCQLHNIELSIV